MHLWGSGTDLTFLTDPTCGPVKRKSWLSQSHLVNWVGCKNQTVALGNDPWSRPASPASPPGFLQAPNNREGAVLLCPSGCSGLSSSTRGSLAEGQPYFPVWALLTRSTGPRPLHLLRTPLFPPHCLSGPSLSEATWVSTVGSGGVVLFHSCNCQPSVYPQRYLRAAGWMTSPPRPSPWPSWLPQGSARVLPVTLLRVTGEECLIRSPCLPHPFLLFLLCPAPQGAGFPHLPFLLCLLPEVPMVQ